MSYHIKNPCSENWNAMLPSKDGKFCEVCSKNVHDFSKFSENDIADLFKSKSSVCARIPMTAKNSIRITAFDLLSIKTTFMNVVRILILVLCLNVTVSCSDSEEKKTLYYSQRTDTMSYISGEPVFVAPTSVDSIGGPKDHETSAYMIPEEMPEFKGEIAALHTYLQKNIQYPKAEWDRKITGKVFVKFVVDSVGNVTQARVLKSSPHNEHFEEEALRAIKAMPRWKPGKNNGKPVSSVYHVPVRFQID